MIVCKYSESENVHFPNLSIEVINGDQRGKCTWGIIMVPFPIILKSSKVVLFFKPTFATARSHFIKY